MNDDFGLPGEHACPVCRARLLYRAAVGAMLLTIVFVCLGMALVAFIFAALAWMLYAAGMKAAAR